MCLGFDNEYFVCVLIGKLVEKEFALVERTITLRGYRLENSSQFPWKEVLYAIIVREADFIQCDKDFAILVIDFQQRSIL